MPVGLLPIIYLAFISLGLPDSAIGSAWPVMAGDLHAGISWVGAVTMIISLGTIFSSFMSVRVVERLGTGRVTVLSVVLTAAALVGFSLAQEFWQLCVLAVPYGLGAGAVDAALNSYVAVHYESQHMSWLHCMWGVGASTGPIVMAQCLSGATWSTGFLVLGGIQVLIAVALTLSLPLWRDRSLPQPGPEVTGRRAHRTRREILRIDGVVAVLISFFCYCALEGTFGTWAATYLTLGRGIDAGTAAGWASLFFIGITAGRAVSGFVSMKVREHNMIRLGQALIAAGLIAVVAPGTDALLAPGLVCLGVGCAPIYPSIIHATPARFGEDVALELTGMQMAFANIGSLVMSPLFGVIAQSIDVRLYPVYLAALLAVMVLAAERLNRVMRRKHLAAGR